MAEPSPSDTVRIKVTQDLGLRDVVILGLTAMVGAGIFVLSGTIARVAGVAAVLGIGMAAFVVLLNSLAYAELAGARPDAAGGGYGWVRGTLPGPSGFLSGWLSWAGHLTPAPLPEVRRAAAAGSRARNRPRGGDVLRRLPGVRDDRPGLRPREVAPPHDPRGDLRGPRDLRRAVPRVLPRDPRERPHGPGPLQPPDAHGLGLPRPRPPSRVPLRGERDPRPVRRRAGPVHRRGRDRDGDGAPVEPRLRDAGRVHNGAGWEPAPGRRERPGGESDPQERPGGGRRPWTVVPDPSLHRGTRRDRRRPVPPPVHARELRPDRGTPPAPRRRPRVPGPPRADRPDPHRGGEPRARDRPVPVPEARERGRRARTGRMDHRRHLARRRARAVLRPRGPRSRVARGGEGARGTPGRPHRGGGPVRSGEVPRLPAAAGVRRPRPRRVRRRRREGTERRAQPPQRRRDPEQPPTEGDQVPVRGRPDPRPPEARPDRGTDGRGHPRRRQDREPRVRDHPGHAEGGGREPPRDGLAGGAGGGGQEGPRVEHRLPDRERSERPRRVQDEGAPAPDRADRRAELAPLERPGGRRHRPDPRKASRRETHGPEHRGGSRDGGGDQGRHPRAPGEGPRRGARHRAESRVLKSVRVHGVAGDRRGGPPPRAGEPDGRCPSVLPGACGRPDREARDGPGADLPEGHEIGPLSPSPEVCPPTRGGPHGAISTIDPLRNQTSGVAFPVWKSASATGAGICSRYAPNSTRHVPPSGRQAFKRAGRFGWTRMSIRTRVGMSSPPATDMNRGSPTVPKASMRAENESRRSEGNASYSTPAPGFGNDSRNSTRL